jgi:hypothetical protein
MLKTTNPGEIVKCEQYFRRYEMAILIFFPTNQKQTEIFQLFLCTYLSF